MLKIGIIGKITASCEFLNKYGNINNCSIVAISSADKDIAEKYGIEKYFADYRDLICDDNIDAVLVTSEFYDYNKAVLEALRCGKHVLSEKGLDMADKEDEMATQTRHREDFNRILDYINRNFRENINTSTVAKALFISRSYAKSVFTEYSTKTINEYIGELRISYANILLRQGADITTTSEESGFVCIRTFNNVYKKVMGITPTEYKERNMK